MTKWCEIFRTGQHKDSKGKPFNCTISDLERLKTNYENVHNQVPICCGHPQTNSPAYGWFDQLKIAPNKKAGYSLYSTFKNVLPEFKEADKKGLFKTRSLSFTKDGIIRHLAFLGGGTPAIKGLEQFCFSDYDKENDSIFEFEDFDDNYQPDGGDKSADSGALGGGISSHNLKNEKEFSMNEEEKLKEEIQVKDGKIAELEAQLQTKNAELETKTAELKAKEDEADRRDFADWTDTMITEGRILPAQRNDVINILTAVNDSGFEFDDGGNGNKINAEESLKRFVGSIKQLDLKDTDSRDFEDDDDDAINFSDAEDVATNIKKVQKEHFEKTGVELNSAEALAQLKRTAAEGDRRKR